jgi:hypothetical protein
MRVLKRTIFYATLQRHESGEGEITWAVTKERNGYCYFGRTGLNTGRWEMHQWFADRDTALEHVVGLVLEAREDGWGDL